MTNDQLREICKELFQKHIPNAKVLIFTIEDTEDGTQDHNLICNSCVPCMTTHLLEHIIVEGIRHADGVEEVVN